MIAFFVGFLKIKIILVFINRVLFSTVSIKGTFSRIFVIEGKSKKVVPTGYIAYSNSPKEFPFN